MNLSVIDTPTLYEYEAIFLSKINEIRDLKTELEELLSDPIVQDEEDPVGRIIRLTLEPRVTELAEILASLRGRLNHIICEIIARTDS